MKALNQTMSTVNFVSAILLVAILAVVALTYTVLSSPKAYASKNFSTSTATTTPTSTPTTTPGTKGSH